MPGETCPSIHQVPHGWSLVWDGLPISLTPPPLQGTPSLFPKMASCVHQAMEFIAQFAQLETPAPSETKALRCPVAKGCTGGFPQPTPDSTLTLLFEVLQHSMKL